MDESCEINELRFQNTKSGKSTTIMADPETRNTVRQLSATLLCPLESESNPHTLMPWDPATFIPDLSGKVAIVPGAK
jgi:hypothetical protein